ncbi:hypothetical protein JQ615_05555 [Bradyrhizobium jicamae]|uniref:Uncharacterized protein n=1 Tax=Bradyrhizobium jicamae TaxID=280332 RepID=A0ABS5FDI7_9BRAD|nr:hypothetical protein [Bradyrhizobium jicamae]MBR0794856.1 hypothetical protein [Bradyrhizobium jicamae]
MQDDKQRFEKQLSTPLLRRASEWPLFEKPPVSLRSMLTSEGCIRPLWMRGTSDAILVVDSAEALSSRTREHKTGQLPARELAEEGETSQLMLSSDIAGNYPVELTEAMRDRRSAMSEPDPQDQVVGRIRSN